MARIRSIKPEFFTDELVSTWPFGTRLTYIGLWTHVDDNGRAADNAALIVAARINARRARTSSARTGHYPADRASVERVIRAAASSAHVSPDGMVALAWCESRLNPLSRSSCCLGLFQQHERYYRARFAKYGRGGRAWQDAEAQSHVAAGMVRDGMLAHWSCSAAYRRAA